MAFLIRAAVPADIPAIHGMIRELAEFEKLSREVLATDEKLLAELFPAPGKPRAECLLAVAEGEAAGYAFFFTTFSTFVAKPGLYLEDLFVKPRLRGRGIGKALLLRVAKLANERDCGRMEWTVLDWNKPAISFYESLGARRMPEWNLCRLTGPALERYGRLEI